MSNGFNDWFCSNGEARKEFEEYISSLTAVSYSIDRDEQGEYVHHAVFHMWSGFCIAKQLTKPK